MLKIRIKKSICNNLIKSGFFDFKKIDNRFDLLNDLSILVNNKNLEITNNNIVVDFIDNNIFNINKELSYDLFLGQENNYSEFLNFFNLQLKLANYKTKSKGSYKKSIVLTPFDFYKLVDSFNNSYINNSVIIFVIDRDKRITAYNAPYEESYISFITLNNLKPDYYFLLQKTQPVDKDIIGEWTSNILISKELVIDKESDSLFPFPIFNRQLSIRSSANKKKTIKECINCNKCNSYCSENLYPNFFYYYLKSEMHNEAESIGIKNCTLCGVCNFICPSNIPLTKNIEIYLNERYDYGY